MKKFLSLSLFFLLISLISAESYRIADVSYYITGMTKEYAIKKAVTVSTVRVFKSYDELHIYIDDIKQQLENQRAFSSVIVNLRYDDHAEVIPDQTDSVQQESSQTISAQPVLVHLSVTVVDSKHFLGVPYPKYDSNTGYIVKLKMKDMNFLGTLSTLNFDVNYTLEKEDEGRSDTYKNPTIGINFDYDYPFPIGKINSSFNNSLGIEYTFGDTLPQVDYDTGFTFELPFDEFSLKLDLTQSITRNTDDYAKYGDEFYFTEGVQLSLPIHISKIDNWGNVDWTPYVSYTNNWDKDGIDIDNTDLSGPVYAIGHGLSTSRVNWHGNFRQGMNFSASQSLSYNDQTEDITPKVSTELKAYKSLKYVGFSTDLYVFGCLNGTENIGSRLRGIRDNQYFDDIDSYACKTSAVIVGSIDMPVHIFTTNWLGLEDSIFGADSKISNAFRFMRYFDFELQISPFVDFALTKNKATNTTFNIKDGFYAGGLEFLVYPQKWKGFVVRASAGVDVGRKIIYKAVPSLINTSWRDMSVSTLEVYIGIGLQY